MCLLRQRQIARCGQTRSGPPNQKWQASEAVRRRILCPGGARKPKGVNGPKVRGYVDLLIWRAAGLFCSGYYGCFAFRLQAIEIVGQTFGARPLHPAATELLCVNPADAAAVAAASFACGHC